MDQPPAYGLNNKYIPMFNIPIVLFIFKRAEKTVQILHHISKINPSKIYIIGDGPRNDEEKADVLICRRLVEENIPTHCKLVTNYAVVNRGVYENIAGGAKYVLSQEKWAIFLEDDNLPELSFFPFCDELLHKYEDDNRILWICGTNYLKEYDFPDGVSYGFTQNMMPCGWASWATKFNRFYEGDLSLWKNPHIKSIIKSLPYDSKLKKQDMNNWDMELLHLAKFGKFASWDYQMSFSLRIHNLVGIVPKYNQITNIGVDIHSIHGGTSYEHEMTRRFCGLPTKEIEFPLLHPISIIPYHDYEVKAGHIITLPWKMRIKKKLSGFLKCIFRIAPFESLTGTIKSKLSINDHR